MTVEKLDTWEDRITAASAALGITPNELTDALAALGISEHPEGLVVLEDSSFAIRDFFEVFDKSPKVKVRMAFAFLKGSKKEESRRSVDPKLAALLNLGVNPDINDVDTQVLLGVCDPGDVENAATRVLKSRYQDCPVIVFKEDSNDIDIALTMSVISDKKQGLLPWMQSSCWIDDRVHTCRPVGRLPDLILEEDPLYPGEPLVRGRSRKNFFLWKCVSLQHRQFCRLLVQASKINPEDVTHMDLLSSLVKEDLDVMGKKWPAIYLEFKEKAREESLPRLQILPSSKKNNPFGVNRRY